MMAKKNRWTERKLSVADAVSEAFGELQSLGEEVREAYDNTPESLQQAAIGEARDEAASALENIDEPDVPEVLQSEKFNEDKFLVKWNVPNRTQKQTLRLSRSVRRDDAVATAQAVVDYLEEMIDDKEQATDEERAAAFDLQDSVQQMIDEAEAVDFPGRNA